MWRNHWQRQWIRWEDRWSPNLELGKTIRLQFKWYSYRQTFSHSEKKQNKTNKQQQQQQKTERERKRQRERDRQTDRQTESSKTIFLECPKAKIISPLLFCVFINDLPNAFHLHQSKVIFVPLMALLIQLTTKQTILFYVRIYKQESVNNISDWCWIISRVQYPTKAKCLLMASIETHQKEKLSSKLSSHVHGNRTVREDRFLGATVDEQLKWQTYIDERCKTVTRFFFSCFKIKPNNKPRSPTSFFLHIHYVAHNLCFKCKGWDEFQCTHETPLFFSTNVQ